MIKYGRKPTDVSPDFEYRKRLYETDYDDLSEADLAYKKKYQTTGQWQADMQLIAIQRVYDRSEKKGSIMEDMLDRAERDQLGGNGMTPTIKFG